MKNLLFIAKLVGQLSKIGDVATAWDELQKLLKLARHLETPEKRDAFLVEVEKFIAKTKF